MDQENDCTCGICDGHTRCQHLEVVICLHEPRFYVLEPDDIIRNTSTDQLLSLDSPEGKAVAREALRQFGESLDQEQEGCLAGCLADHMRAINIELLEIYST